MRDAKSPDAHRRASARRAFVVKVCTFFFLENDIVWLDKTVIPRLGSCRAL